VSDGPLRRAAAWGVHLVTASSAAAGILALLATWRGDVRTAFAWLAWAVAADAVDGTLARAVGVKRVLPAIDGARLDDIVDYLTYVVVPAVFLVHMRLLPDGIAAPVACAVALASAFGFANVAAKTADHYFTGFPSYWNVVAFYLYVLRWPPAVNAAIVLLLAVLVFVPIRYVYPSRTRALQPLTIGLGLAWGVAVLWVIVHLDAPPRALVLASLLFPAYYFAASIALTLRRA
jgi:phosphatidylcholine synthase